MQQESYEIGESLQKIKQKKSTRFQIEKVLWYLSIIVLCMVVLLFLIISFYNYPGADDYSYGVNTYQILIQNGSIFQVLKEAINNTVSSYNQWQGSFSAIFLMSLNPAIFGEQYYFIGTFLFLFMLIFSEIYIINSMFAVIMNISKYNCRFITMVLLITQLLFVPFIVQSLFWFNGSVYYTFFYSLSLILFGLVINRSGNWVTYSLFHKIKWIFICMLVSGFIAGGNYSSGLVTAILLTVFTGISILKKSKACIFSFIVTSFYYICFFINALAPGNKIRQNHSQRLSVLQSILKSFTTGAEFLYSWTHIYIVFVFILLIPFLLKGLKKAKIVFAYPVAVVAFSFCLFCSFFTPSLYAMASSGPGRMQAMIYYAFLLILLFDFVYVLGWLKNRLRWLERLSNLKNKFLYMWVLICLVVILNSLQIGGIKNTNPMSAYFSLKSNRAKQYELENEERLFILKNLEVKDAVIKDFSVKPYVLYFDDIEDVNNWKNFSMAKYYGKDSVSLESYVNNNE